MKHMIVFCGSVILGMFIYNLIMGSQDDSIINSLHNAWQVGIETRTYSK
ncbi:MAG: hypothetical protein PHW03_00820 [Eubacteriales bacterium]|nr:hypothetical protein [Eubacteriales bacterium]MDD4389324.1 hypothetical protein [Eubacteriales bacterium]